MDKNFTPNDLVQLIYREVSEQEADAMYDAMDTDKALKNAYKEIREGYQTMPKAQFSPSRNTIQNILRYSQESAVPA